MSQLDPFGWVGRRIADRFAIDAVAGHGSFGVVYRGRHLALGEHVAVKCLKLPPDLDEARRAAFLDELRTEARILHRLSKKTAAIVQALDLGAATAPSGAWTPYVVMEWLEGETLESDLLRRRATRVGPRSLRETLEVLRPAAEALAVAHGEDVAHLDTKPGNLFLVEAGATRKLKLLDFGIAKVLGDGTRASAAAETVKLAMSPRYAAPEQFEPAYGPTGPWTDVFALGLLVIELATGEPALEGDTVLQLLFRATHPTRPSLAARGIVSSPAFEAALERALAVDPKRRFPSAGELWEALDAALAPPTPGPRASAAAAPLAPIDPVWGGGENRICTILAAEPSGFAELARLLEPEELSEMVERCFAALAAPVERLGGTVEKLAGGGLFGVFGIPRATDNDAERALTAALAMHEALATFSPPRAARTATFSLRVGIATGRVFAGRGAKPGHEPGVVGEPVATATSLARAAPMASTLLDRNTHRQIAGLFDVEPLGDGRFRVTGRAAARSALVGPDFLGLETKLIGRAGELDRLRDAFDEVTSERRPVIVTLAGAAGVGRSRLLLELTRSIEGRSEVAIFAAQCSPFTADTSYGLVASLLRGRFHIHDDDPADVVERKVTRGLRDLDEQRARGFEDDAAAEMARIVGAREGGPNQAIAEDEVAAQARHRIAAAFARLVTLAAARRTVVLVCDDVQWADDASLDLLDELLVRAGEIPLLVVCAARPQLYERRPHWGEGKSSHRRVDVPPLSRRHMEEMARDRLRRVRALSPEVVRALAERADGNALTMTETLHLLCDAGVLQVGSDAWTIDEASLGELTLPTTIQGIVQARLDRVEAAPRETLARAAVIGKTFWEGAVVTLGAPGAARDSFQVGTELAELRERKLIRARDTSAFPGERELTFAESAIQEVAYATTSLKVRGALHGRVAAWLRERAPGDANAALMALHLDRAGELGAAADAYARAATHAADLGQNVEALRHLQRVRAIHEESAGERREPGSETRVASWRDRVRLRIELGDVLRRMGRLDEAEAAHEEARARILRVERRAGDALDATEGAVWEARIDLRLALAHKLRGEIARARALVERAIAGATEAGAAAETPAMWATLAALLRREKQLDACRAAVTSGLRVARSLGASDPRRSGPVSDLLVSLGGVFYSRGSLVRAERCWRQAARVAEGTPSARFALNNIAVVRYARGDLEGARDTFLRVLAINQTVGDLYDLAVVKNNLAELELRLGDAAHALEHAKHSVRILEQLGAAADLPDAVKNLAEASLASGDADAALETGARALALAEVGAAQVYLGDAVQALAKIARAFLDAGDGPGRRARVEAVASELERCLEVHADVPSLATRMPAHREALAGLRVR